MWQSRSVRALVGTGLGSLPGFILPFAVVWRLDAGRLTDAYFLAYAIATFVASILSIVFEVNIIPAAEACRRSGATALAKFVRTTVRNAAGVAGALYIPTGIVGVLLVDSRHDWIASERHLCLVLVFIFGGYIVATAITSVLDGTLYALDSFFAPTLSQCVRTLIPLVFIVVTPRTTAGAIFTASLFVGGEFARALLLVVLVRGKVRAVVGDGSEVKPSRLLAASVPHAMSVIVVSASPLVDKVVASGLGPRSVTLVELGERVFFLPFLAISSSIVLVAGTKWAQLVHDEPAGLGKHFAVTLRRVLGVSAAAAVLVGGAVTLMTLVAGHVFLGLSASNFRTIVWIFLAGLPGAMVINQGARLMTAVQRTRALPLFAVTAFTVNIVGDIVGAHLLGIEGIAWASTLFRTVNALIYIRVCRILLRSFEPARDGSHRRVGFLFQ